MSGVSTWLEGLGLGQYADAFSDNDIDASVLRDLTEDALKDIGVASVGHRMRLLKAIAALDGGGVPVAEDAPAAPGAERRQVTVLFCDMVGSTALSEKLDPEDLRDVMRAYQDACAGAIARYDGHIAQTLGDGLMVYFGYPQAHEDDAARAVRAGIDIVEAVRGVDAGLPVDVAVRVGVHTGLVVAGEVGGADTRAADAIVGETPNVAARVQGMAKPNTVFVSEATHGLTAGAFTWDDLGTKKAKGVTGGIHVYQPTGATEAESRFEARTAKGMTPLVGRIEEIGLVMGRWNHAKDGEGQVVLLSGEAGIGKSRVTQVLRERIGGEAFSYLRLQCSPYYTNSAFYPFIAQFERIAKFPRDASPDEKLERMEELLAVGDDDLTQVAPLYAALLSIDTGERYTPLNMSPQRQKEKTIEAIAEQTAGIARHGPVVVIFEDAHWADPTTLEVLEAMIGRIETAPVLMIITYRPEFEAPWTQSHITQLTLSRLAKRQCSDMVAKVTGGKALPDEVLTQIIAKADGVPLFVEELTKTVLEAGFLRRAGEAYVLGGPLPPLAIPATLQDSLIARLDRLSPVKEIAQVGAVIGREFSYDLLSVVSPLQGRSLDDALDRLVGAEILFRRGASPNVKYYFKHGLIQDAAYDTLLLSRRRQIHAQIAEAFTKRSPGRAETEPEAVAYHYGEAHLWDQAAPLWLRAGQRDVARSANLEAIAHLSKGIETVRQMPPGREASSIELDLQISLGSARIADSGYSSKETEAAYLRGRALIDEIGGDLRQFAVLHGLCMLYWNRARHARMGEVAQDMLERANGQNESLPRLVAHRVIAVGLNPMGRFELAHDHAKKAVELYEREPPQDSAHQFGHDQGVGAYWHLSIPLLFLGRCDAAAAAGAHASSLARDLNNATTGAYDSLWAAFTSLVRGDWEAARAISEAMIESAVERSMLLWAVFGRHILGSALAPLGEAEAAIEMIRLGRDQARQISNAIFEPMTLRFEAQALAALGRADEALVCLGEALDTVEATGERWWEAEIHRLRGEINVRRGVRAADSEKSFRRAMDVAAGQGAKLLELRAAMSLARLWGEQGERRKAHDLLHPVYDWFTEGFDTADLKDAKALLAELAS